MATRVQSGGNKCQMATVLRQFDATCSSSVSFLPEWWCMHLPSCSLGPRSHRRFDRHHRCPTGQHGRCVDQDGTGKQEAAAAFRAAMLGSRDRVTERRWRCGNRSAQEEVCRCWKNGAEDGKGFFVDWPHKKKKKLQVCSKDQSFNPDSKPVWHAEIEGDRWMQTLEKNKDK